MKDRLGPVLFQLPPGFECDLDQLERFPRALKSHGAGRKIRCTIEVRDATWLVPPVFDMLREYRTALCFADWRDTHVTEPVTADFVYIRRHRGSGKDGKYTKRELDRDVDVYIYFNNDWKGFAIDNAKYVQAQLRAQ